MNVILMILGLFGTIIGILGATGVVTTDKLFPIAVVAFLMTGIAAFWVLKKKDS